jgi:hypothetical protein
MAMGLLVTSAQNIDSNRCQSTYKPQHLRFIYEAVAKTFKIFRDAHVLPKLLSYEECRRDR